MESATPVSGNGGTDPAAGVPSFQVAAQYIKDLSFENPGAPASLTQPPLTEISVDLQARRGDAEHFEVEMKLRLDTKSATDNKPLFILELVYAGLFRLQNIPEEAIQQILLIEAPHLLFPFARRIAADIVRDGGMPPLTIEPIDFLALYRSKMSQQPPASA